MLSASHPIRVLVVEDSPTVRRYLTTLINETPGLEVIGEARDGDEALAMTAELQPDVVSMDIRMPGVDGLEATRRIMNRYPTPVVIVSGLVEREVDLSFQALQAGALAVVEKPPYRHDPDFSAKQRQMVNTLTAMARVHVVRRWENEPGQNGGVSNIQTGKLRITTERLRPKPEIIAIGASAGGPGALAGLLRNLPVDFSVPIMIVQHIPHEFVNGLARWLGKATTLGIRVATDNLILEAGVVHLAPGFAHGVVARQGDKLVTRLVHEKGHYRYQPSVDVLFESVANVCGSAAVGIVLTGMGDDGASGLLEMRKVGAHTFAQDEASSTVFGMPQAAIARGAVEHVLALSNLAITLSRFNLM
jgi:two-component system, chemotaxis family, protein-glutamate methylesterase/glutaminase